MKKAKYLIFILGFVLLGFTGWFNPSIAKADTINLNQSSETTSPTNIVVPYVNDPGGGGGVFALKTGDIVITSSTSFGGLTGHAGIVTSDGLILHIPNDSSPVLKYTWSQWTQRYPNTEVLREPNSTVASMAASWAQSHYWTTNRNPGYNILSSLSVTNPTYCSKIVWQAYYYGTGSYQVEWVPSGVVNPYNLRLYFYQSYAPYHVYGPLIAS